MNLYNCKYDRKCNIHPESKDNGFEITSVEKLDSYDNVEHLMAFIIDNDIYNVCDSGDHGSALGALKEKYDKYKAVVLALSPDGSWSLMHEAHSIETLRTIKEVLISIRHRIYGDGYIYVGNVDPNIESNNYRKEDMDSLIQQVDKAIKIKENELSEEEKEAMINSIVEQLENRKKESFADKARRFLCGR